MLEARAWNFDFKALPAGLNKLPCCGKCLSTFQPGDRMMLLPCYQSRRGNKSDRGSTFGDTMSSAAPKTTWSSTERSVKITANIAGTFDGLDDENNPFKNDYSHNFHQKCLTEWL